MNTLNKNDMAKYFDNLPRKMVLTGGGMFANELIIVNVLKVGYADHPMRGHDGEKVMQATVEERRYNGIENFEPYLLMYNLSPINDKYADIPIDTYRDNLNGTLTGRYTKAFIKKRQ